MMSAGHDVSSLNNSLSLFAIDTHCTRVRFIHCSGVCSVVTGLVVCSGDSNSCFPN